MGSETWNIAHPTDREDYHPPEDVDLAQWLSDHYLTGENRQPDIQIAGTPAIHFRHEASPQSFALISIILLVQVSCTRSPSVTQARRRMWS